MTKKWLIVALLVVIGGLVWYYTSRPAADTEDYAIDDEGERSESALAEDGFGASESVDGQLDSQ